MWTKVGYVAVNIILLIFYAYFFGHQSIEKYMKNGVIIVKEEDNSGLPPPGKQVSKIDVNQRQIYRYFPCSSYNRHYTKSR